MAKRLFSTAGSSFVAVADTTGIATNSIMGIQPANATQTVLVSEISVSGQASAATIANGIFARTSTAVVGASALASPFADGGLNPSISALSSPVKSYSTWATTAPQRSALTTDARLNLSLNGFGGIYRWVAYPGEEWYIVGTGTTSESGFSLTTAQSGATCALGVHIVYEAL